MRDDEIVKIIRSYQCKIKGLQGFRALVIPVLMIGAAVFPFLFVYMAVLSYKTIYFGMVAAFFVVLLLLLLIADNRIERLCYYSYFGENARR